MGGFENLLQAVAGVSSSSSSSSSSTDSTGPSERTGGRRLSVAEHKAINARDAQEDSGTVLKQEDVNRRATLLSDITEKAEEEDGVSKPYDPRLLRDLAQNPIAQTYIDTLAQDTASAEWKIRPRDEDADVPASLISLAERRFADLFPDLTVPQALELLARNLLQVGDATIIKHYRGGPEGGELAEAVPVDSSTLFKKVDDDGFTEGYIQVQKAKREYETVPFDLREVVWISWSERTSHIYGQSPVEKGRDTIEVLEEIADKEILDLVQGMPPGVLSRQITGDGQAILDDGDWQNLKDDMRLQEGERHRLAFTKYPVEYQKFSANYQELQLLERYRTKITELGGVMKVNPSYAGFEFQNVNRATDESQREAFKQRGFRVLLRALESALNSGIIPELLDEEDLQEEGVLDDLDEDADVDDAVATDLVLRFDRERTVGEQKERARMLQEAVEAGGKAADRGLTATFRNGSVEIEDGELEESEDDGGGGLFMSDDDSLGKSVSVEEDDVRRAYEVAGEPYDETEARTPVVLSYPAGGVPVSAEASGAWEAVFADLLDRGASAVLGLRGDGRPFPAETPSDHDPQIAVYGLSEEAVQNVVDLHPDVSLRARETDAATLYEGDTGNS